MRWLSLGDPNKSLVPTGTDRRHSSGVEQHRHHMVPAVYIMCGIPFSGKSTLADRLSVQCGWTHVHVDDIKRKLIDPDDGDITEEQWLKVFAESHVRVADSLKRGQTVVHDATNFTRAVRGQIRAIAHEFGSDAHVIYVDMSIEKANRRRIGNRSLQSRHQVSDADFIEVTSGMEPPTEDESVLIFDGSLDVTTWIEHVICGEG